MSDLETTSIATILQDDDPLLRKVSEPVTEFGDKLAQLVRTMVFTVRHHRARGLAAVQIGVLERVIIGIADNRFHVMINPVITRTLNRETVEIEGCLSVNRGKLARKVSRPAKCDITWQDMSGAEYSASFSGDSARVLQHEIDHLNGILITDKPSF